MLRYVMTALIPYDVREKQTVDRVDNSCKEIKVPGFASESLGEALS